MDCGHGKIKTECQICSVMNEYRAELNGNVSNFKKTKIRNQTFLDAVKLLPCLCCNRTPSDPDHITSRGAGGDDSKSNIWPLCRRHHNERHARGLVYMTDKYPKLKDWLHKNERFDVLNLIENKRLKK